jgi:hypothetical protein
VASLGKESLCRVGTMASEESDRRFSGRGSFSKVMSPDWIGAIGM